MVALPTQLFYNTQIPACLWFLARDRKNHKYRDRSNEILFINARKAGAMASRKHRVLDDQEDIAKITATYHNWRNKYGDYQDEPGFCKTATLKEVEDNNFVLTPGRYVGTEEIEDNCVSFEEKVATISAELTDQFAKSNELQERIRTNLAKVGIEI